MSENNYLIGLQGMKSMLVDIEKPMDSFKKKYYESHFNSVYDQYLPTLDAIESVYSSVMEPEAFIHNMAEALVEVAVGKVESEPRKNKKEAVMMDLNLVMAVYVFPMILKYKGKSSQPLVDEVMSQWKKAFPRSNIQAAEYEYIEKGFHKKFCYITTAVCQTFGKPDDCYELTLLRNYRDHYLAELPEGEEIIKAYYDVAPTIVKHINRQKDSSDIYQGIWSQYLSPCIHMIEEGKNEECKELYKQMVEELQKEYFYTEN